jgi:hypothetical protein
MTVEPLEAAVQRHSLTLSVYIYNLYRRIEYDSDITKLSLRIIGTNPVKIP